MKAISALIVTLLATASLAEKVPQDATLTRPLKVGATIPEATVYTENGEPFKLRQAAKKQPLVLVFYRGGWCPYCSTHLSGLQAVNKKLTSRGYRMLAVSPDRPEKLKETARDYLLGYTLLSDSSMAAGRAFGLAFQLDDATVRKYREEYKIDVEADSGQTHHQLPVPAVYIVDTDGKIIFAHTNPDYKKRLDPGALVGAANLLTFRPDKKPEKETGRERFPGER